MPSPTGRSPASTGEARGRRLGSLIGGIFGLIYVEANVGSLPYLWATALRVAAAVAFAGLVAALAVARGPRAPAVPATGVGFGSRYWLVVAGEVAAIPAGAAILRPAGLGHAVVAWVSVVVGVHFVVLAAVWRLQLFRPLGAAIALCGVAGLIAAAVGAPTAAIAGVGAVLPGMLLLAAGYSGAVGALREHTRTRRASNPAGLPVELLALHGQVRRQPERR
jgi:hypothetical protein